MKTRNSRRDRKGLTLMEVMLVLVILGVMGSMAMMFLTSARESALKRVTKAEIDSFVGFIGRYSTDMFSDPTQLLDLIEQPSSDTNNRWQGPYMKPNDLKDPWTNDYEYEQTTINGMASFTIKSAGPDGSMGSEDDISSEDQF